MMKSNRQRNQGQSDELKRRFDQFLRQSRYGEKPYRLLGKPQIGSNQVSALIAYPEFESEADREGFAAVVGGHLREYGLDPAEPARQKSGLRVLARLLEAKQPDEGGDSKIEA